MKRWQKVFLWVAGIVAALWGAHALDYPTITFNYRLTVEAMTPDGPKTGSSVIQVSYGSQFNVNGGGRKGDTHVTGEALYLDLGRDRNLFVLLSNNESGRPIKSWDRPLEFAHDAIYLPIYVFGFKWDWGEEWSLWRQVRVAKAGGPRAVPLAALPTTVTFRDVSDPTSVGLLDPRDIALTFGRGYSITKATMEITDSPTGNMLTGTLTWLPDYLGTPLRRSEDKYHPDLQSMLSSGDFKIIKGKL